MKRFVNRHNELISWLSGLGIPVAILVAGWLVTTSIESSRIDSEYVKIALGILSEHAKDVEGNPIEFTEDEIALRRWAVRLLNTKSPEKFRLDEEQAFIRSEIKSASISYFDEVVNGKRGTAMAAFGEALSAADLNAVITFERKSFADADSEEQVKVDILGE